MSDNGIDAFASMFTFLFLLIVQLQILCPVSIFTFAVSGVLSEHGVFMQGGGGEGLQPRPGRRLQECHGDKVRHTCH